MKLTVNFEILDLSGKALPDRANKFIAEILVDTKGDALKLYELAMNISKSESIEIDTTDLNIVVKAIRDHERFNNLVKGAILKEIESQKTIST